MGPRGFGGFCLALLCFGVEEEPGNGNVTEEGTKGTPGQPRAGTGDATSPPGSGDTEGTAEGNGTRASPAVPARYWSPVIFVVLALLVLFVTYHRTRDRGIRDQVTSGSDSSDLGALVQPHDPNPVPKIPTLKRDWKEPEPPPELSETSFGTSGKRNSATGPTDPTT